MFQQYIFLDITPVLSQKRSVEDLKERYYCICGKLTKVRAASGAEPKIYIFDAGHERRRKEQLDKLFNRTPEQVSGGRGCTRDRPIRVYYG